MTRSSTLTIASILAAGTFSLSLLAQAPAPAGAPAAGQAPAGGGRAGRAGGGGGGGGRGGPNRTDTNNDGVYDRRTVFVDHMVFPRFVLPYGPNTILTKESNAQEVWKYTDTNGDGVADKKELFGTGYGRIDNVEQEESSMTWAMDNWLYTTFNTGPATLHGRVQRIEPAGFTKVSALGVEEQRVNVVIEFDAPSLNAPSFNAPILGDNFRVDVRIVVWKADAVVKAPLGSLFRRGEKWAVFVVDQGRAHERMVTIGERSSGEAEIRDGLAKGDVVIMYPPDTITDGMRVKEVGQR